MTYAAGPTGPESRDVTVLYIAGSGRSGSTLLDMILGQVDGFASAGELRYFWSRGVLEDRLCGCGKRFSACPQWTAVLAAAGITDAPAEARRMGRLQHRRVRVRHLPAMLRRRRRRHDPTATPDAYGEGLARLYRAVRDVTGAEVIVDSSKLPAYGFHLAEVPGIRVHVVHLVRDPRAAAYSWLRKKVQPDRGAPGYMDPQGTARSSVLWATWNTAARWFWNGGSIPYVLVRYEDFVQRPTATLEKILELVGHAGRPLPFVSADTVQLQPNHTVAGNPNRLRSGAVTIRGDDEWRTSMRARDRRLVTILTSPVLRRFGYQLQSKP